MTERATTSPADGPRAPAIVIRVNAALARLSTGQLRAVVALIMLTIGTIDTITGPEIASSIFYAAPVIIAAWHLGWRASLATVIGCALTWVVADILAGHDYEHPLVQYWNALVRGAFFLLTAYLITLLRNALAHEQDLARTDVLTGLANVRSFDELATRELVRARRFHAPISLAYLDVDGFKYVNDSRGHAAGDDLLRMIAGELRAAVREGDIIARMGGDEFAILLPDADSVGVHTVIERVLNRLATAARRDGWPVGFSAGVITAAQPPNELHSLIRAADDAMYEVKRGGGRAATYRRYEPEPASVPTAREE